MYRTLLCVVLTLVCVQAAGQHALEVIPLRHRTVDQVLPALRPLLEPGATLTGQGTQLIVRTSPANLAELQRALDAIDRPLRRLVISVRLDDAFQGSSRDIGAGAQVTNRGGRVEIRADERRGNESGRVDQRIQVLEGGRAYIATGESTPIFDGSVFRQSASGFEAIPRLAGDRVHVELAQRRDSGERQQGLATSVSARLGEWFEVGALVEQAAREGRGIASAQRGSSSGARRIWLKVEELSR